jgi:competence protein ComEC
LFGGLLLGKAIPFRTMGWVAILAPLAALTWRRKNSVTVLIVVLLCLACGWWRGSLYATQVAVYQQFAKQKISIVGRATTDGVYGEHEQLTFTMDHLRIVSPMQRQLVGQISVGGFGAPAVYRGDDVEASGSLYPTRGSSQASVSFAELTVLGSHPSFIDGLRQRFTAGVQSALPEPEASFGLGLLVGQRNTLPQAVSQTLLMVGLTHIIAVSGYNLTILLKMARKLFGKRSKFQATVAFLVLIGTFVLLTGSSPSIVRAAMVSLLSIAAWYYGRPLRPLVLLLVSGVITALANPLYVWGNVSWYLSFLAFFGVLVLAPLVTKRLYGSREPKLIASMIIESLCAEAMTLPYVLHIFGQMSSVSILANVLIAALIPLAMFLSLVAGLAGMLVSPLAGWFAWPAKLLLTYMLDVAGLLSRIPHAFIEQIGFSTWLMVASYGIVLGLCVILRHQNKRQYAIITDRIALETEGA